MWTKLYKKHLHHISKSDIILLFGKTQIQLRQVSYVNDENSTGVVGNVDIGVTDGKGRVGDWSEDSLGSLGNNLTFGIFIREKRMTLDPHISLRKMATLLNLSPVHMSNIETGRDAAPKSEALFKLAEILKLRKCEQEIMFDLAAKSKNYVAVPADLPEYISTHEYAKIALRVAKDVDATDAEWIEFIEKLRERGKAKETQQGGTIK